MVCLLRNFAVRCSRSSPIVIILIISSIADIWSTTQAHRQRAAPSGDDAKPSICICPESSETWHTVPDTMDVPDDIVERLKVRRMIVCEHGVFFNFRAGQRSDCRSWWLGLVPPTREQYRYCFERELEGVALELRLTQAVEKAAKRYKELREEIKRFLGDRYRKSMMVYFDRAYCRGPVLEGISTIDWRGRKLEFGLIPNLYVHR